LRDIKLIKSNLSNRCRLIFSYLRYNSLSDGRLSILSWLVLLLFAVALLSGVFVPIYIDEVALLLLKARFFDENWTLVSLLPQCKSSFISSLPLTWYPAVAFYGIVYSHLSLIGLRLSGVFGALLWVTVIAFWSFKTSQKKAERLYMIAGLLALSSFGVMPFILILARSEQVMILCLSYYCIVPLFFGFKRLYSLRSRSVVICSFILVTSILYFCHPKSLFFTPLILASAICTLQSLNWRLLLFLTLIIFLSAYQSYNHAKLSGQCEEAPIVRTTFAFTLEPGLLISQPRLFFDHALRNLKFARLRIVQHVPFQNLYQSGWLPPATETVGDRLAEKLNVLTNIIYTNLIFVALFLLIFRIVNEIRLRWISSHTILAAALLVSLIGHAAFYNIDSWNFYTSGLMIPALILFLLLVWPEDFYKRFSRKYAHIILALLLIFAAMNLCALMVNVAPRLIEQSISRTSSIQGQWLSVTPFNFDEQKSTILALADQCGIKGDGASRLVVDHVTYYAFDHLRQPLHVLYISEDGFGGDIKGREIVSFLNEMGSPGIIARCSYIPPVLRNVVKDMRGYCCIGETLFIGSGAPSLPRGYINK
jgi:hypothetical protein